MDQLVKDFKHLHYHLEREENKEKKNKEFERSIRDLSKARAEATSLDKIETDLIANLEQQAVTLYFDFFDFFVMLTLIFFVAQSVKRLVDFLRTLTVFFFRNTQLLV